MAEDTKNDVLMNLLGTDNQYIAADCHAVINRDDGLAGDFRPNKFFEVDSFNFGVGVVDGPSEGSRKTEMSMRDAMKLAGNDKAKAKAIMEKAGGGSARSGIDHAAWRFGRSGTPMSFPVDIQEVTISRTLDHASPQLFKACATKRMFRSAALIKRTVTGETTGLVTFMRLDFNGVVLTDVEWEDGDMIKETLKFVTRGVSASYSKVDATGAMRVGSGKWDPFDRTRE